MDDCFRDSVIDEDQIVFDFGDGDFELKQPNNHDSLPCASDFDFFEEAPELLSSRTGPARDQTLLINSHDLDRRDRDCAERGLEVDSSEVSLSVENCQNLFAEVYEEDDANLGKSSGNLHQTLSSLNCNLENGKTSIFPLSHVLAADVQSHPVDVQSHPADIQSHPADVQSHPVDVHSHPADVQTHPVDVQSHPADAFHSPGTSVFSNSPPSHAFPPVPYPPVSPPVSIPPSFPPISNPKQPPLSSLLDDHDLTETSESAKVSTPSIQLIRDPVCCLPKAVSIQPSSSFNPHPPTTSPLQQLFNSAYSHHHPSIDDDKDDDEFDFDELVASRIQSKPGSEKSTAKTEEEEKESAAAIQFDVEIGSKAGESQTKASEDNSVTVPPPGQRSEEALVQVSDDWNKVETIEPDFEEGQSTAFKARSGTEPITFGEAVLALDHNKLAQQFGRSIRTSVVRGTLASLFHRLCGGPRLLHRLQAERDFAFCLAACPFNNEDLIHCRVLFSIYKQLTGSKFDCARFGSQWEIIGFQGQDPATDLRGAGFLALLQLLHLVTDLKTQALARSIYRLSLHETQNFPFCVMGINLTRITMAAMREDCLNKECNRRGEVLAVLNDFYVGLFHRLQVVWKSDHKTIRDTGFVLADLESYAKKHSEDMARITNQIQPTFDAPVRRQDKTATDIVHIDEHIF